MDGESCLLLFWICVATAMLCDSIGRKLARVRPDKLPFIVNKNHVMSLNPESGRPERDALAIWWRFELPSALLHLASLCLLAFALGIPFFIWRP